MIIGIMGYMGTGKDTVSDILVAEKNFSKLSFADSLKDVVSSVFGWDRELVEGATPESRDFRNVVDPWWSEELDIKDFTPRLALQLVGTELFRTHFNGDIWVKNSMRRASQHDDVVFADVRFVNEAKAIKDAGGVLIRVKKGEDPMWHVDAVMASDGDTVAMAYLELNYSSVHRSEWDCLSVKEDYLIENDGTLKDLKEKVLKISKDLS